MFKLLFVAPINTILTRSQLVPQSIRDSTRYQALPGNADPEALPPIVPASEAEPLDTCSQAEPRNQLFANEAEPLDIGSQAEPRNQVIQT